MLMRATRSMRNAPTIQRQSRRLAQRKRHFAGTSRGKAVTALLPLLDSLADLLLATGMTPAEFNRLAKTSFVSAATRSSRLRNGRVNASRVAALTGLTRAEIREILSSNKGSAIPPAITSPVLRVLEGWSSDPEFASESGRPRALPPRGWSQSFAELVRRYSGDIPAKAMQSELQRLGAIRTKGARIFLNHQAMFTDTRALTALIQLSNFVAPVVRSAHQLAVRKNRLTSKMIRLKLNSNVDLNLVEKRAAEILSSSISALRALGDSRAKDSANAKAAGARPEILISLALRTTAGTRNSAKGR